MKNPNGQRGFAMIAAIVLVVILGGLMTYMLSLAATQRETANIALHSARTLAGARAGLEWGIFREAGSTAAPLTADGVANCNGGFTLSSGIVVTISCVVSQQPENGQTVDVYVITSLAESGSYGDPDYVRRRLRATVIVGP
jgi:MSHA biogenesis protein MshP